MTTRLLTLVLLCSLGAACASAPAEPVVTIGADLLAARTAFDGGQYDAAAEAYGRALADAASPDRAAALYELALLRLSEHPGQHDPNEARMHLDAVASEYPSYRSAEVTALRMLIARLQDVTSTLVEEGSSVKRLRRELGAKEQELHRQQEALESVTDELLGSD